MNNKSGNIHQFKELSSFKDLKELNRHTEMWLLEYKQQFTKGELLGLKRLIRYSAKVPGVCNAKIGTILKAIHEEYEGNGISRSTFKRMIVKAKEYGILTVYETERKNGSQTSNLYIFNRFPKNEPPKQKKMNQLNKTINLSKTLQKDIKKRSEDPIIENNKNESFQSDKPSQKEDLDYTYTNDSVPKAFVNVVKYFFSDAKTIEEYWHLTKITAYRNNREQEKEQVLEYSIHSFKQLVNKLKTSATVRNPFAYYYGILNKKFEELYFEELFEMGF